MSEPTAYEAVTEQFLTAAHRSIAAACKPGNTTEDLAMHTNVACLAGLVAYLLEQIRQYDTGTANDVAWEVHDFAEDGEPLADWVAGQLRARGLNPDALAA